MKVQDIIKGSSEDFAFSELMFTRPNFASKVVEINEIGPLIIEGYLNDGEHFVYDQPDDIVRRLPKDPYNMNEQEFKNDISYRIRLAMQKRHITQTELADELGIARPSLNRYLTGKVVPSFYIIDKIAKVLDCSTDEFRFIN